MPYLLNLVYLLLLLAASPWLLWRAVRTGRYRRGFAEKLLGRVPRRTSDRPCLWLHAVSVGEVNLLGRLLDEIARRAPQVECVLSTTTQTGMDLARKKYPDRQVFYCPLDFSWATRAAVRRIRPDLLVLVELELWPNLIRAARESGARVAVVNGRLGQKSFRGYRRIRPLVGRVLRQIDLVAAQDETYARRFRELGAADEAVRVTGSMKYDGAQTDRDNPATAKLRRLAGFDPEDVVFLAGSTQPGEDEAALATFAELAPRWPRLRLVLVPRHPERFDAVGRLLDRSGFAWRRRSELAAGPEGPAELNAGAFGTAGQAGGGTRRILLVDAVGELGAWWGTARIAFVGGSFGRRGGQNMIEPAAYGAAVSFGPNTWNFRDVVAAMLDHDAAVVVPDGPALTRFVQRCLVDPDYAEGLGCRAKGFVSTQSGATWRTVELLIGQMGQTRLARPAA